MSNNLNNSNVKVDLLNDTYFDIIIINDSKFLGTFKKSRAIGYGAFLNEVSVPVDSASKNSKLVCYRGEYFLDKLNGYAQYFNNPQEYYYEGEWANDYQSGFGIENFNDGSYYAGEFKKNKKHGFGYYQFKDGSFYKGSFQNNSFCGFV